MLRRNFISFLAGALVNLVNTGLTPSPAADLARAEKLIDEALAAGTKNRPTMSKAPSCATKDDGTMRFPSSKQRWPSTAI